MGKRVTRGLALSWIAVAGVLCPGVSIGLQAAEFPNCESFGVQRFQEKKEAISFSLKDLDGRQVCLSDFRGKPLLIFFWATWCISCKEDVVLLQKCYAEKPAPLEMLTIVIDGEKEKKVRRAVKKYALTLPVLLDNKEKLARAYGVRLIPTTFLIDGDGVLKGAIVGQRDWCDLKAFSAIREVLNL